MQSSKKSPLMIIFVIVLGAITGKLLGRDTHFFGITYYSLFDLLGRLFINALMLVVIPLVMSSIITGISQIGTDKSFKRLGIKTFGFYLGTTLLAILIGLLFVNLFHPGEGLSPSSGAPVENVDRLSSKEQINIESILLKLIPSNIFVALFKGEMLGIIFFSFLFGLAIAKIESNLSKTLIQFWKGLFQAMIRVTQMIIKCLPIGVFCLVAKVSASTGVNTLKPLALFIFSVLLGLLTFSFVIIPLILKIIAKVNPLSHFKAMSPALITAFSTSSTSATLPITMECVEKRAGVSSRICSLVIPLGCSINMSGSALYECVAALFIAQIYGLELTFLTQFFIVLLSLLVSMGTAGIPSGSIIGVIVILKTMGIPTEGIGIIIAVDRILDMCRTTVNVLSDSCCAVLVATTEGEQNILKNPPYAKQV